MFAVVLASACYAGQPEIKSSSCWAFSCLWSFYWRRLHGPIGRSPSCDPCWTWFSALSPGERSLRPSYCQACRSQEQLPAPTPISMLRRAPKHNLLYFIFQSFDGLQISGSYWFGSANGYIETSAYVGVIALVFAAASLAFRTHRREVVALLGVVVVMSRDHFHPLTSLLDQLPVVRKAGLAPGPVRDGFRPCRTCRYWGQRDGRAGRSNLARDHCGLRRSRFWIVVPRSLFLSGMICRRLRRRSERGVSSGLLQQQRSESSSPAFYWFGRVEQIQATNANGSSDWMIRGVTTGRFRLTYSWLGGFILLACETAFLVSAGAPLWSSSSAFYTLTPAETTLKQLVGSSTVGVAVSVANFVVSTSRSKLLHGHHGQCEQRGQYTRTKRLRPRHSHELFQILEHSFRADGRAWIL